MGARQATKTGEAASLLKTRHESEHARLGLSDDQVMDMYFKMLLARSLDERQWILNRQGKMPFVIGCQGHEAAGVGTAYALRRGVDGIFPYYRSLPACLVMGMTPREVMLQALAKAEDPNSGGRQMPSHWSHVALRIFNSSSPVATQIPQAVGAALAARMRGEDTVIAVYFGDGATSKGDFHEALNFAAIHRLPVVFICENNEYAISVPLSKQMPVKSVADRAAAYAMPGVSTDGSDVLAVYRAATEAVERARRGDGPTLLEARVVRLSPHSSDDDDRYRQPEEKEIARQKDPIVRCKRYLEEQGLLNEEHDQQLRLKVESLVLDALEYAESRPDPRPEDALRHVYSEGKRV